VLTRAQGDAVLADLDKAFAAALARAETNRAEGESGIVAGILGFLDHTLVIDSSGVSVVSTGDYSHAGQLDAQVGAVNMIGSAIQRLRSDLPAAVDVPAAGDRWSDAARYAAHELESLQSDITAATIEDTLAQTAAATGNQVKEGVNIVAGNTARLVWSAIPWWVLVGGALVGAGFVYLQVRRVA
jgi:hypothetical protein